MARDSGSYGSYRDWAAAQRAEQRALEQAAKKAEADRKAREREQAAAESAARDQEALAKTDAIEHRVVELQGLLRSSLGRDPRISFASLKRNAAIPPLSLGKLGTPIPAPQWADYEPEAPRGMQRLFGGAQRYQDAHKDAEDIPGA